MFQGVVQTKIIYGYYMIIYGGYIELPVVIMELIVKYIQQRFDILLKCRIDNSTFKLYGNTGLIANSIGYEAGKHKIKIKILTNNVALRIGFYRNLTSDKLSKYSDNDFNDWFINRHNSVCVHNNGYNLHDNDTLEGSFNIDGQVYDHIKMNKHMRLNSS